MESKDEHQIKPVGYQGRYTKITFLSLNNKTRRQGEDLTGHRLQARISPLWDFCIPEKTENPFGRSKIPRNPDIQERRKRTTRWQYRRPPRWSVDQAEEKSQQIPRNIQWKKILWQLQILLRKTSYIKNRKGNPQERSRALKCLPKSPRWSEYTVLNKKTFGRSELPQRAGVNYMGVEAALTANPK